MKMIPILLIAFAVGCSPSGRNAKVEYDVEQGRRLDVVESDIKKLYSEMGQMRADLSQGGAAKPGGALKNDGELVERLTKMEQAVIMALGSSAESVKDVNALKAKSLDLEMRLAKLEDAVGMIVANTQSFRMKHCLADKGRCSCIGYVSSGVSKCDWGSKEVKWGAEWYCLNCFHDYSHHPETADISCFAKGCQCTGWEEGTPETDREYATCKKCGHTSKLHNMNRAKRLGCNGDGAKKGDTK